MSSVHIELGTPDERGRPRGGKILVDGHDVGPAAVGFSLRHQVGHVPQLELELRVHDVTSFATPHALVLIDPAAAGHLERAGWTPPPGERSVLQRDANGCPCDRHTWWEMPDGVMVEREVPGAVRKTILGRTVPTCPVHGVNARKANS